jgi:UDPglucose 6-dehydrogenase
MNVTMVGAGRVGLVAAACLADFGISVHCVDNQPEKIESLQAGLVPFHEPGLAELVHKNVRADRLSFTMDLPEAIRRSLVVFIAVGTEEEDQPGVPNLKPLYTVAKDIARQMTEYKVLAIKSTVPVGTARHLAEALMKETTVEFDIVSNPEFLREGSAIENFMHPDRIVLGGRSQHALAILKDIYRPLYLIETPIVTTNNETAELAKYASNAFLALKISFINEIANFSDATDVDVHAVAKILGLDKRVGPKFLHPGPGYGGSCLPKDTRALLSTGRELGLVLRTVEGAVRTNDEICSYLVERIRKSMETLEGRTIGVLGLAYKPFTDDVRESRAIDFVRLLLKEGAIVRAHDPAANASAAQLLQHEHLQFFDSAYEAATGSEALSILTEWNEFRNLDLGEIKKVMKGSLLLDARNVIDPDAAASNGLVYLGRGRGAKTPVPVAAV